MCRPSRLLHDSKTESLLLEEIVPARIMRDILLYLSPSVADLQDESVKFLTCFCLFFALGIGTRQPISMAGIRAVQLECLAKIPDGQSKFLFRKKRIAPSSGTFGRSCYRSFEPLPEAAWLPKMLPRAQRLQHDEP